MLIQLCVCFSQSAEYTKWRSPLEYPQNLMRNIAKSGCQTNFTFVPDVDMIPNAGLDLSLENFLMKEQKCAKCAFVVPVYEISTKATHLPNNKTELVSYIKANMARQFHQVNDPINLPKQV